MCRLTRRLFRRTRTCAQPQSVATKPSQTTKPSAACGAGISKPPSATTAQQSVPIAPQPDNNGDTFTQVSSKPTDSANATEAAESKNNKQCSPEGAMLETLMGDDKKIRDTAIAEGRSQGSKDGRTIGGSTGLFRGMRANIGASRGMQKGAAQGAKTAGFLIAAKNLVKNPSSADLSNLPQNLRNEISAAMKKEGGMTRDESIDFASKIVDYADNQAQNSRRQAYAEYGLRAPESSNSKISELKEGLQKLKETPTAQIAAMTNNLTPEQLKTATQELDGKSPVEKLSLLAEKYPQVLPDMMNSVTENFLNGNLQNSNGAGKEFLSDLMKNGNVEKLVNSFKKMAENNPEIANKLVEQGKEFVQKLVNSDKFAEVATKIAEKAPEVIDKINQFNPKILPMILEGAASKISDMTKNMSAKELDEKIGKPFQSLLGGVGNSSLASSFKPVLDKLAAESNTKDAFAGLKTAIQELQAKIISNRASEFASSALDKIGSLSGNIFASRK